MNHKLTLRKALPKMFKAFHDRKLICQNGGEDPSMKRPDGCVCIIGAALPNRTLVEGIRADINCGHIDAFVDHSLVKFRNDDERETFDALLELHDDGCRGPKLERRKYRRRLAAKLNGLAKDLGLELDPIVVN